MHRQNMEAMNNENYFSIQRKSLETTNAAAHTVQKMSAAPLLDNRLNGTAQRVVQLATHGHNQGQPFTHNGKQTTVGKSMWAKLDPADKLQGQSASVNKDQDDLMEDIRDEYNLKGNEVVKGHLLNDNLGGSALDNNLFPISGEANKAHLHNVESVVKDVYELGMGMYYKVDVEGQAKLKNPNAKFKVQLAHWDPVKDKIGEYLTTNMGVSSMLARAKRKRAEVSGLKVDKKSKIYMKLKKDLMKKKRQKLHKPIKLVGGLSKNAKALRDKQPMNLDIEDAL